MGALSVHKKNTSYLFEIQISNDKVSLRREQYLNYFFYKDAKGETSLIWFLRIFLNNLYK